MDSFLTCASPSPPPTAKTKRAKKKRRAFAYSQENLKDDDSEKRNVPVFCSSFLIANTIKLNVFKCISFMTSFSENGLLSYENPNYHMDPQRIESNSHLYEEILSELQQQNTIRTTGKSHIVSNRKDYARLDIGSMGVDLKEHFHRYHHHIYSVCSSLFSTFDSIGRIVATRCDVFA